MPNLEKASRVPVQILSLLHLGVTLCRDLTHKTIMGPQPSTAVEAERAASRLL